MKHASRLFLGLLFAFIGISAIITRSVGSATIREMQASGSGAVFVGVLFLIMAAMMLID